MTNRTRTSRRRDAPTRLPGAGCRFRTPNAPMIVALALAAAATASGQVWENGNRAVGHGTGQDNEHYGAALVKGDFGAGVWDDLAVAAPEWDQLTVPPLRLDAGTIDFALGSPAGLVTPFTNFHRWGFDADYFGAVLAAADFDHNLRTELVIARPGYSFEADQAGAVHVFIPFETSPGVFSWGEDFLAPGFSLPGTSEPFDRFGEVLAVGRFDGDVYWDLAIGTPGENLESPALALDAGEIMIIYGSATGLDRSRAHLINENTGTLGGAQDSAHFGAALASQDFNGDGYFDLAIGVPDRDVVSGTLKTDAGEVVILFGSAGGLTTTGHQRLTEASLSQGIETGDHFGAALAAGDFDATALCLFVTCYADLAIGVPGQFDLGHPESGKIMVVYGAAGGLNPADRDFLFQDLLGDGGSVPADFDHFGSVLAAGLVDSRIGVDLVIGVPDENVGANADQGMVHLVFGGPGGLRSYPGQFVIQRPGFQSAPGVASDRFGAALAIGDFDHQGHDDLAIGIPGRSFGGHAGAGMVQILYGALFADGFESGGTSNWAP